MGALLPVNIDSRYANSGTDDSIQLHQQYHDQLHGAVNGIGVGQVGLGLDKYGRLFTAGFSGGTADAGLVEGANVWWDINAKKFKMVYTGYNSGVTVASIMLASSYDGLTWTSDSTTPLLAGSGSGVDASGCTAPTMYYENGTYYLFYTGLQVSGYEGQPYNICLATATSLTGTWTRQGSQIARGSSSGVSVWRQTAVFKTAIVKRDATYYMFFNAGNDATVPGSEQIGYATATSLAGPWTVDDANSPLLVLGSGSTWDSKKQGDPFVYQVDDTWYMAYYGYDGTHVQDGLAYTSDASFPLGWAKHPASPTLTHSGTSGAYDQNGAGKPSIISVGGRQFHYFTAGVNPGASGGIGLAISRPGDPLAVHLTGTETVSGAKTFTSAANRFSAKSPSNGTCSLTIGDDIAASTGTGRAKLVVGNTSGNSEFVVGQDGTHSILFYWTYNATPANAVGNFETYGGTNQLNVQNNAGKLSLGGSGGSVGFYGVTPLARALLATGASHTVDDVITALQNLGLVRQS